MKTHIKYAMIGAVVLIVVIGLWALQGGSSGHKNTISTGEPIKIGGISALTGVGVAIGEEERKGALLAVEEINAAGGLMGANGESHPLQLISEDVSIDKIKVAVSVAQKLISVDKVAAIVGPQWDETTVPILPIIEEAKIPTIGTNSSPMLKATQDYKYFFSTWYDNRVGIRELLRFAQARGLKKIAIVKPLSAGFWEYTARLFTKEAPNYGVQIVDEIDMGNPLSLDFKTTLLKIKGENPDAIFNVTSDYNQCTFLKQAAQVGYKNITLGTEASGDSTSLSQCPDLMENKRFFSTPVRSDANKAFLERYKTRFGTYPNDPSAATSYDAVMVVARGLKDSGLQGGEKLRDAIAKIKDLHGVALANILFMENGFVNTPENAYEIETVKDGKFVKVAY